MGRLTAVRIDYRATEIGNALEDARTGLTVGEFVAGLGVTRYQYQAVCTGKLNGRTANRLLDMLDSGLGIQGQPIVVSRPPRMKFKAAGNVRRALRAAIRRLRARREGTARFWDHVDKQAEHWLWTAGVNSNGVGVLNNARFGYTVAERAAWELVNGPIPTGYRLANFCGVRACVNPKHWRLVVPEVLRQVAIQARRAYIMATANDRAVAAFWSRVAKTEDGCWEWQGGKLGTGYGHFISQHLTEHSAHRITWTLTNGPIPDGLFVCHHCDNPGCCNPDHLFLGTAADNVHDSMAKGRRPTALKVTKPPMSRSECLALARKGLDAYNASRTPAQKKEQWRRLMAGKQAKRATLAQMQEAHQ